MKARIHNETWQSLSPRERKRIEDIVDDKLNDEAMIITDKLLKMSCQVLHENLGFGETRCMYFLAGFERIFKEAREQVASGKQDETLNAKMDEIFKNGYPKYFFEAMFDNWNPGGENE